MAETIQLPIGFGGVIGFEVKLVMKVSLTQSVSARATKLLPARLDTFVKDNLADGKLNAIDKKDNGVDLPTELTSN